MNGVRSSEWTLRDTCSRTEWKKDGLLILPYIIMEIFYQLIQWNRLVRHGEGHYRWWHYIWETRWCYIVFVHQKCRQCSYDENWAAGCQNELLRDIYETELPCHRKILWHVCRVLCENNTTMNDNLIKFRKVFESKPKEISITLCGPVVFPHLDYCVKFDDLISKWI